MMHKPMLPAPKADVFDANKTSNATKEIIRFHDGVKEAMLSSDKEMLLLGWTVDFHGRGTALQMNEKQRIV